MDAVVSPHVHQSAYLYTVGLLVDIFFTMCQKGGWCIDLYKSYMNTDHHPAAIQSSCHTQGVRTETNQIVSWCHDWILSKQVSDVLSLCFCVYRFLQGSLTRRTFCRFLSVRPVPFVTWLSMKRLCHSLTQSEKRQEPTIL